MPFHESQPFDPSAAADRWPSHPRHGDPLFTIGCPECEVAHALLSIEQDLRDLSLDLWVAGWTPDELLGHVRGAVDDPRAPDLVAHGILYDDSLRADHARPEIWREQTASLSRERGLERRDLRGGWVAAWIEKNSSYHTSRDIAAVIQLTLRTLTDLVCPGVELPIR